MRSDLRQWGEDSQHLHWKKIQVHFMSAMLAHPAWVGKCILFVKIAASLSCFCFVHVFLCETRAPRLFSVSKSIGTEKGHVANCGPAIIFFSGCRFPKHLPASRARCCKEEKQTFLVWVFRYITRERSQSHMRMKTYTTPSLPFFIYFLNLFYV